MRTQGSAFFSPRMTAAFCWSLMPLFSLPLAFGRIAGDKIPLWGNVTGAEIAEMGVFSLALIVLFPERLIRHWRESRFFRRIAVAAGLFLLAGTIRQFRFCDAWSNWEITLFYAAVPFSAAALAPELKRLLPLTAAGEALLLAVSGILTEHFTGFCGNWNWTQALLLALLPSLFLLLSPAHPARWSLAAAAGLFCWLFFRFPAEASRAFLPVLAASALILWAANRINRTWLSLALFEGIVILFLLLLYLCRDVANSRIQLWLGALSLGMHHPVCGSGMGRYLFLAPQWLPELYFTTKYMAPLHLHPHNELLWFFCGGGIPGILWLAALFATVLKGKKSDPLPLFFRWSAITLFLWGMVDMPMAIPLGAWWFLAAAGILLTDGEREKAAEKIPCSTLRTATAAFLLLWAFSHITANIRGGNELRAGNLAARQGEYEKAEEHYLRSVMIRPGREALYALASLALEKDNDWTMTLHYLTLMEEDGTPSYLHSSRLKAIALANSGDLVHAREELAKEIRCFPASLIDARLNAEMAPPEERSAAVIRYLRLCDARQVPYERAKELTPEADDSPYPAKALEGR